MSGRSGVHRISTCVQMKMRPPPQCDTDLDRTVFCRTQHESLIFQNGRVQIEVASTVSDFRLARPSSGPVSVMEYQMVGISATTIIEPFYERLVRELRAVYSNRALYAESVSCECGSIRPLIAYGF